MPEKCKDKLKIDERFKRLKPPLSIIEMQQLENEIIRNGCCEPPCVWDDTIIYGHEQYEICMKLQISFKLERFYFKNYEEAVVWICSNQLLRKNITGETRKYLIGKRYEMEKTLGMYRFIENGRNKNSKIGITFSPEYDLSKNPYRISKRLGDEYCISYATVDKYRRYAEAIDSLFKTAPDFASRILAGQIKVSHNSVIEMSQLPSEEISHLSEEWIEFDGYAGIRKTLPSPKKHLEKLKIQIPITSVKDMPVYDPDAEVSSLTLTIPSWSRSIERTRTTAKLNSVSGQACRKLEKELWRLKESIDIMLSTIKEVI